MLRLISVVCSCIQSCVLFGTIFWYVSVESYYSDASSTARVVGSELGVMGKTALHKLLMGTKGYVNTDAYGPHTPRPKSLKIHTFLYTKHLHSAWIADAASFRGG
jgi:hypothetical protein